MLLVFSLLSFSARASLDVYVDVHGGDDGAPGTTPEAPVLTLARAQSVSR